MSRLQELLSANRDYWNQVNSEGNLNYQQNYDNLSFWDKFSQNWQDNMGYLSGDTSREDLLAKQEKYQADINANYTPNSGYGQSLFSNVAAGTYGFTGSVLGGASGIAREYGFNDLADALYGGATTYADVANSATPAGSQRDWGGLSDRIFNGEYYTSTDGLTADMGQMVGSMLPTLMVGGMAGAGAKAALGTRTGANFAARVASSKPAGLVASALNRLPGVSGATGAGVTGAIGAGAMEIAAGGALENFSNAGDVYMNQLADGKSHDEAYGSMSYSLDKGWAPAALDYALDKINITGKGTNIIKALAKGGSKTVVGDLAKVATGMAAGGLAEGYTEAWQEKIQGEAVGDQSAINASMLNPSTWTDNMTNAFGAAAMTGGVLGGVSSTGRVIKDRILDSAVEEAPATIEGVPETTGLEEPVNTAEISAEEQPVDLSGVSVPEEVAIDLSGQDMTNPNQDLFNEMSKTFIEHHPDNPEVARIKSEATNEVIDAITARWDNSTPEEVQELRPNKFHAEFANLGLTEAEAARASKGLVDNLKKAKPLPPVDSKALLQEAKEMGVNLSPAEEQNLASDNPSSVTIKEVQRRIKKVQPKVEKAKEENSIQRQQENYRKQVLNNYVQTEYPNSTNKAFFDRVTPNTKAEPRKSAETAYKFKQAMTERNRDIKAGKPASNVQKYLEKQGITKEKYGQNAIQEMVDYTKAMDEARISNQNITDLGAQKLANKASATNINNVMGVNKFHKSLLKNAHGDNIEKAHEQIGDNMVQLAEQGFDVTQLDEYKKLERGARGNQKVLIDRLQRINEALGVSARAEIAQVQPKVEKEAPKEEVPKKRTRTNKPKEYKGYKEASKIFTKEATVSDGMTSLYDLEKNESLDDEQREQVKSIRKLVDSIRNEETGEIAMRESTESAKQEAVKIMEEHKELQDKVKSGSITAKDFTKKANDIKKRAEQLFRAFPNQENLKLVVGSEAMYKVPSVNAIIKALREDSVAIPKTVINALMSKPANFNKTALNFINNTFGTSMSSLQSNIRNEVVEKALASEYKNLIEKYKDNDGILEANPEGLKSFVSRVAGAFPTADYSTDGKEASQSTKEVIFGKKSKALYKRGKDHKPMVELAKTYFENVTKQKAEKKAEEDKPATKKHMNSKGLVVTKDGVKATISTKAINDPDYPIEITVKFDKAEEATDENVESLLEEAGNKLYFDPLEADIVSNENGTVKLTSRPNLSYTNFNVSKSQAGVYKALVESIHKAIENVPNKEIMFTVNENADISGLQPILDQLYGKNTYKVDTSIVGNDKEVFVLKKGSNLEESRDIIADNNALYQRGQQDGVARNINDIATGSDVDSIKEVFQRAPKGIQLNGKQVHELTTSLLYWLGRENFPKAVEYLKTAKYLEVNVDSERKPDNGFTSTDYGIIRIKPENISATSSTFIHELVHDIVFNVLEGNNKLANNYIKGLFNTALSAARRRRNGRERREAMERLVSRGEGRGIRNLRILPTGDSRDRGQRRDQSSSVVYAGENRLDNSGAVSQNRLGEPSSGSSNVGSSNGSRGLGVRDSRLGSHDVDKAGIGHGTGLQQSETQHRVLDNRRRLSRGWVQSQNFVDKTSKADIESGKAFKRMFDKLDNIFKDQNLYMSDKAELIGAWLNAARQLDKKYRTNLLEQLSNDYTIFQETLAYGSHTFMAPSQLGAIFNYGKESMNPDKRLAVANDPMKQAVLVHRMGGTGRAKAKANARTKEISTKKALFNISAAVTTLENLMDPSLDKYGEALVVIKPESLDKVANYTGTYDMRSMVDRKYKILEGKHGNEYVTSIIDEFGNRGIVNGKGALGEIALAMFSDVSVNKDDLKQNLLYRQRKEITPKQMADFENRIGHMITDLYVKYSNDNKAKYLRESPLSYDKMQNIILNKATYKKDKATGELQYEFNGGSGKSVIQKSFFSGVMNVFRHYAENGGKTDIAEVFNKYSGDKVVSDKMLKDIEKIANYMNEFQTTYGEVKYSEELPANMIHGVYDPNQTLEPDQVKAFRDAGVRVIRDFKGQTVAEYIANEKKGPLFQYGKDDMEHNPAEASANLAESWKEKIENAIKKENERIEVYRRANNKDSIRMYGLLKELRSPSSLAKKHFPELISFIEEARQVQRNTQRTLKKYYSMMDRVYGQLKTEENEIAFQKLKTEIADRRMEFAQVIPAIMKDGSKKFVIIKEGEIFEEFETDEDAKKYKDELEKDGYKILIDYNNQRFRVFASKDSIRGYASLDQANKIAIQDSAKIAKQKGYNETVWKAYVEYRKVMDEIAIEAANADKRAGNAEPQKYLWGYSPFEHSKFGVYIEDSIVGDKGEEEKIRVAQASFRTERAARKWIKENLINNPEYKDKTFSIVEQDRNYNNPRNDFDSHYSTIENDYFKDHVIEEYKSAEEKEAELKRLQGLYPEMKKLVDSGVINKPMDQAEFLSIINDKKTMSRLGISAKDLNNEMKKANLTELFKRNRKVSKKNLIEFFYMNTGDFARNKHNMTRVLGAQGSNPNMKRADYDYIVSMARHINNAEWYHKATTAYEHWFKQAYKANRSTGGMSNKEEMMYTLIRNVMGVPNHFDTRLNEIMNEIPMLGEFMTKNYGETWTTDFIKRSMEVTALTKLGLGRPTAMFAQLGVMANIYTMTGFNENFWKAQEIALKGNSNEKYKELYSYIGIGEDYQGVESDVFNDSRSLSRNTKVGKAASKMMILFEMGDNFTRRVSAIYAYEKALSEGKTKEEALRAADDFVVATNFDYTDIDSPGIFLRAGVVGKLLLQFKKYPIKQLEFMNDITNLLDLPDNPSVADIEKAKKARRQRLVRFAGSYIAMAGMLGMPLAGATDELAAWITGVKPTDAIKELMYEWAGKDPTRQWIAKATIYGLPGALGVDFTRNIGLGDVVPTDSSELAGPTFGTMSSMYKAFKYDQGVKNILLGELHAIAPFYTNLYQAIGTGKMRDWKAGLDTRPYTGPERLAKALGFRPIRESMDGDMANILYNKVQGVKDSKKAAIYKYLDNPSAANKKALEKYGVTDKDVANTKASLQASKLEKVSSMVGKNNKSKAYEELRKSKEVFNEFADEEGE